MATEERQTDGFTLVELVVVVVVIGTLIAIVAPTLLGARQRADARVAETLVHDAVVAARSSDQDGYASVTPADLSRTEPAVHFVDGATTASTDRHEISVAVGTTGGGDDYIVLTSRSHGGECFAAVDHDRAPVAYQRTGAGPCRADAFDPSTGWSDTWP
jgi:prepilin-type N-terminal cleavage/methylation domain-containing protein